MNNIQSYIRDYIKNNPFKITKNIIKALKVIYNNLYKVIKIKAEL